MSLMLFYVDSIGISNQPFKYNSRISTAMDVVSLLLRDQFGLEFLHVALCNLDDCILMRLQLLVSILQYLRTKAIRLGI